MEVARALTHSKKLTTYLSHLSHSALEKVLLDKGIIDDKCKRFKNHYLVTPNEIMDPDNIHQWLLTPLGEKLIGSFVIDDITTTHQSILKSPKVEQTDIRFFLK